MLIPVVDCERWTSKAETWVQAAAFQGFIGPLGTFGVGLKRYYWTGAL